MQQHSFMSCKTFLACELLRSSLSIDVVHCMRGQVAPASPELAQTAAVCVALQCDVQFGVVYAMRLIASLLIGWPTSAYLTC
jgi:hypothetical protein